TSGSFSATHQYVNAATYTATVFVTDDNTGQSNVASFKYAAIRISVDSGNGFNPGSSGKTPVKIFAETGFDPNLINASTLRFGPAGAKITAEGLQSGGNSGFKRAHFNTQETGILATDKEVYLTGQLTDGTFFIGFDSIRIVGGCNGNQSNDPRATYYVADASTDTIYQYLSSGSLLDSFSLPTGMKEVRGVAADKNLDLLWAVDRDTAQVAVMN